MNFLTHTYLLKMNLKLYVLNLPMPAPSPEKMIRGTLALFSTFLQLLIYTQQYIY